MGLVSLHMKGEFKLFYYFQDLASPGTGCLFMVKKTLDPKHQNKDRISTLVIKEMAGWEKEEVPT